jgi:hypothetical protein
MSNALNVGIKKPCDKECTILALQADLEYADGKPATNKDGVRQNLSMEVQWHTNVFP